MTAHALKFYLSDREVEVQTQDLEVQRALQAVWQSCARPMVCVERAHVVRARPLSDRIRIEVDGELVEEIVSARDLLPVLDLALYTQLVRWSVPGRVFLHAASLVGQGAAFLIAGPSGAGKSSLAWAGVEHGYRYAGDEICLSDGSRLWGIPRAVLYDPMPEGAALPWWIEGADVASYRFYDARGARRALPLRRPAAHQIVSEAWPCETTYVIVAERGAHTVLEPLEPLAALSLLYRERWGDDRVELPRLVRRGRCYRLIWHDPQVAWRLLERHVAGP